MAFYSFSNISDSSNSKTVRSKQRAEQPFHISDDDNAPNFPRYFVVAQIK